MSQIHSKFSISPDKTKIFYQVSRAGPTCLVFLHGMGGGLTAWKQEVRHFNLENFSTIAVDLRGHGNSDRPTDESSYTFTSQAQDILSILKAENFKHYVLVGHCYGGMIALALEANYPKITQALILVDTSHKLPTVGRIFFDNPITPRLIRVLAKIMPKSIKASGRENFQNYKGRGDWYLPRLLSDMAHTSLKSYLLSSENLVGYNATKLLGKITVPTLVLEGTRDSVFPPEIAYDLNHRIKTSIIDLLPNENHVVVINNPAAINSEIDKFLRFLKLDH